PSAWSASTPASRSQPSAVAGGAATKQQNSSLQPDSLEGLMSQTTATAPRPVIREDGPIHEWFGLTYANHQVLHRSLMQSMPREWQERMVRCLEELQVAYQHLPQAEAYEIIPGTEHEVGSLTADQLTAAGVTFESDAAGFIDRYWRDG